MQLHNETIEIGDRIIKISQPWRKGTIIRIMTMYPNEKYYTIEWDGGSISPQSHSMIRPYLGIDN